MTIAERVINIHMSVSQDRWGKQECILQMESVCLLADAPEGFEGDEQSRAPAGLHLLSSYYGNTASFGGWGWGLIH